MDEQILAELAQDLEPQLPDALHRIKQLWHDDRFRDMCVEYEDGVNCLRRLREGQSKRIDEVTKLIEDSEREILQYLQNH
jgi:hypothetical protein